MIYTHNSALELMILIPGQPHRHCLPNRAIAHQLWMDGYWGQSFYRMLLWMLRESLQTPGTGYLLQSLGMEQRNGQVLSILL